MYNVMMSISENVLEKFKPIFMFMTFNLQVTILKGK